MTRKRTDWSGIKRTALRHGTSYSSPTSKFSNSKMARRGDTKQQSKEEMRNEADKLIEKFRHVSAAYQPCANGC